VQEDVIKTGHCLGATLFDLMRYASGNGRLSAAVEGRGLMAFEMCPVSNEPCYCSAAGHAHEF